MFRWLYNRVMRSLKKKLDKKQQEVIRLNWKKTQLQSALDKAKLQMDKVAEGDR